MRVVRGAGRARSRQGPGRLRRAVVAVLCCLPGAAAVGAPTLPTPGADRTVAVPVPAWAVPPRPAAPARTTG
ncbi:hypothetical protein ACH4UM_05015 [Streptomyces sp. NPDC020801]|uniref:hypothetical protein n=1 Tax=unclassified Streptomyces TaxID=2593676 RepID=UPI0037A5B693